jgi:hypothetical protein
MLMPNSSRWIADWISNFLWSWDLSTFLFFVHLYCYFIYFRMPKWSPIYNWRCEYSLIHSIVSTPHVIQPRAVTKWYRFLCLFHAPYGCHGNIYLTEFTNILVQSYFKNTISRLLQLLNFLESGQHYGTP